jgi:protein subunit release factor A
MWAMVVHRSKVMKMLEIRSAEGGSDSQMFVQDLSKAYLRLFARKG